ncbi:hypothetical protein AB0L88_07570 [Saccharopolyspora shandongensis]|uniref:hypothetical protein n=1 Tax=Saccharopolyspora shandongensis TaxID=418495 RepID=UPI003421CCC4
MTMLSWKVAGRAYAAAMVETAGRLAEDLHGLGRRYFAAPQAHPLATVHAGAQCWGGGQHAAKRPRRANLLTCGIGLPDTTVDGDMNSLRTGTPELMRRGMTPTDMPARGRDQAVEPERVAPEVTAWRRRFTGVRYTVDQT